jgi:predicted PhzF superfamily epimerase YddE/YHI9
LDEPLADETLQAVAAENNLSETAFVGPGAGSRGLRWFTPAVEVDLCGHATLAAAHVLFETGAAEGSVVFETQSGALRVSRRDGMLEMDFPARPAQRVDLPLCEAEAGLGGAPLEIHKSRDLMVVFESEAHVRALSPDFSRVERWDALGVIATAPGDEVDFVSRFFCPRVGILEDPVTGSAHCTSTPYWAERLGKQTLSARQLSARGGELTCRMAGDRVVISGSAVTYLRGEILVDR